MCMCVRFKCSRSVLQSEIQISRRSDSKTTEDHKLAPKPNLQIIFCYWHPTAAWKWWVLFLTLSAISIIGSRWWHIEFFNRQTEYLQLIIYRNGVKWLNSFLRFLVFYFVQLDKLPQYSIHVLSVDRVKFTTNSESVKTRMPYCQMSNVTCTRMHKDARRTKEAKRKLQNNKQFVRANER